MMATARHLCKWTAVVSEAAFRRGDAAAVLARAAAVARARGCPRPVAVQVPRALLLANAATGRRASVKAMLAVPLQPPVRTTGACSFLWFDHLTVFFPSLFDSVKCFLSLVLTTVCLTLILFFLYSFRLRNNRGLKRRSRSSGGGRGG